MKSAYPLMCWPPPQNSINILMKSLKLTTGPGNPCSGVGMEANGQTAIAEMRSPLETTNGLALDGLTVFNHVGFPVSPRSR